MRGDDPFGPRPAGDLPDTTTALLLGVLVWLVLRAILYTAMAKGLFDDAGFAGLTLAGVLSNLVPALLVLRAAIHGARQPQLPGGGLVLAGVLSGLAAFSIQFVVMTAIQQLTAALGGSIVQQDIVTEAGKIPKGAGVIAFALSTVLLAPLAEEIFFRGILLPALARYCDERRALMIQAIAFGAIHVNLAAPQTLPIAIPLAGVGWFAGWLCLRTGSLVPAILMHATFNALNFAALRSMESGSLSP